MSSNSIKSVFEIANWFFRRADKDDICLENDKLQQLMFIAQLHYTASNNHIPLFAGFFINTSKGIEDPNLSQILKFGLPLMAKPEFEKHISAFLELIWQKYSSLSSLQLEEFIKKSACKTDSDIHNTPLPINIKDLSSEFRNNLKRDTSVSQNSNKQKVLISQNGPVVVSQWQPRKVKSQNPKEN